MGELFGGALLRTDWRLSPIEIIHWSSTIYQFLMGELNSHTGWEAAEIISLELRFLIAITNPN